MTWLTKLFGRAASAKAQNPADRARGGQAVAVVEPLDGRQLLSVTIMPSPMMSMGGSSPSALAQQTAVAAAAQAATPTANIVGSFSGNLTLRRGKGAGLGFPANGVNSSIAAALTISVQNPDGTIAGTLFLPNGNSFNVSGQVIGNRLTSTVSGNGIVGPLNGTIRGQGQSQTIHARMATAVSGGRTSVSILNVQQTQPSTFGALPVLPFNTPGFPSSIFDTSLFGTPGFTAATTPVLTPTPIPVDSVLTTPSSAFITSPATSPFTSSVTGLSPVSSSSDVLAGTTNVGSVFSTSPFVSPGTSAFQTSSATDLTSMV